MFTPFPAGYVLPTATASFMPVWGGVVFGAISAALPLSLATRLTSWPSLRFCALLSGAFCFGHNALYLVVGSIAPFADAANMLSLGASKWVLFVLGLPLLVGFLIALASAIEMVGLRAGDAFWKWIIPVECGLLLCPAVMVLSLIFAPNQQSMRVPMLLLLSAYALCFAVAALRARQLAQRRAVVSDSGLPDSWASTFRLLAGAAVLLAIEWLTFKHGTM